MDPDLSGDVDFDFFETPRNAGSKSTQAVSPPRNMRPDSKPPPASKSPKHGDHEGALKSNTKQQERPRRDSVSSSSASGSDVSDIESDSESSSSGDRSPRRSRENSPRSRGKEQERRTITKPTNIPVRKGKNDVNYMRDNKEEDSYSDSASSYSERSSDEDSHRQKSGRDEKHIGKERPMTSKGGRSRQAWSSEGREKSDVSQKLPRANQNGLKASNNRRDKSLESDSSSKSGSESEMTDVSPLPTPNGSPTMQRKHRVSSDKSESKRKHEDEQDKDLPEDDTGAIQLETSKIDLNILMRAVSEIERERHQRLKANRRVMFAPPKVRSGKPQNYSFSDDRTRIIEKENQRLLNEIVKNVSPHMQPEREVVKEHTRTQPQIRRPTTSAINRKRQLRKIESDNFSLLSRLQHIRPSTGMSRNEQIHDYQRTVLYGVPISTQSKLGLTKDRRAGMSGRTRSMNSFTTSDGLASASSSTMGGTKRARPSSAKSNISLLSMTSSVRSRPGSAKSTSRGYVDSRPAWNDRFSYT